MGSGAVVDIAELQAFTAVADLGSFSGAAERLYVTQPAVSKRIAHLESTMDARLFDRVGRQVLLTEAGRALYPHAVRILAEIEDSRRDLRNLSGRIEGPLSLATSHHVGLHRLPPILRLCRSRFPGVRMDLRFMASEAAYRAVAEGEVELAVVTLSPEPVSGLKAEALWIDRLVPAAAAHGALSGREALQPGDLNAMPAILPGPGTFTRGIVDRALAAVGVTPTVDLSTNFLETIKMMVSVDLGWSVLPVRMIDGDVMMLTLPGLEMTRALGVLRHPGRTLSNAAAAMLALLREQAGGLQPT